MTDSEKVATECFFQVSEMLEAAAASLFTPTSASASVTGSADTRVGPSVLKRLRQRLARVPFSAAGLFCPPDYSIVGSGRLNNIPQENADLFPG